MVKVGFTFRMKRDLTHLLRNGTVWECVEITQPKPTVPHDKVRAWFVRLSEFQMPTKRTVGNSLNFYPESIQRYLDLGYIEVFKHGRDLQIEDLDLSVRAYNCLKRAGINFAADLTQKTYADMVVVRNLGAATLDEVIAKMRKVGLTLKGEPPIED